jgi:hypothetical protein
MTHTRKNQPAYIPTEQQRPDWEQLMIERGEAILADEEARNEWARR